MSSKPGKSILQYFLEGLASSAERDARRKAIEDHLAQNWYTVPEAATLLEEHPKTVYARIRAGEIRASRPSPRKTRIHKQDLVAYLMRVTA
jgi:excisionase family DNA binding protein